MFAVSSRASRGSRVCELRLQSEINEKPFDFPSKERETRGGGGGEATVSYAEENVGFLQRGEQWGRRGGRKKNINKTIFSHYEAVRNAIFTFASSDPLVT